MGAEDSRDWKPRPFSDLYRPSGGKKGSCFWKITEQEAPQTRALRDVFPGRFLAALGVLDTGVSYFPAALVINR